MINKGSVLVTGAGSGLGQTVAELLGQQASTVLCLDLELEKAHATAELVRSGGGLAEGYSADVADEDAIVSVFKRFDASHPPIVGMVTCAGIQSKTPVLQLGAAEWDRVMAVNLRGTFLCVREALERMVSEGRGRIVTIASDTARRGGGRVGKSAYAASKGGVVAFTKSIAREVSGYGGGIRINCVCPGPMMTPMHDDLPETDLKRGIDSVPIGRFGTTQEVANVVSFLLSDEASFVYGETLCVDGGVLMA